MSPRYPSNVAHLELGHAGPQPADDLFSDRVRDRPGARELFDLGLALDPSQAPDLRARINKFARRGAGDQQLGGLDGQMLFLDADFGASLERGAHQRVAVLTVAPRDDLGVLRVAAGFLALDRRHDERRAIGTHRERHQPLERLGVEPGEVGDRNGLCDVRRLQVVPAHPGAQVLQGSGRGGATQCR